MMGRSKSGEIRLPRAYRQLGAKQEKSKIQGPSQGRRDVKGAVLHIPRSQNGSLGEVQMKGKKINKKIKEKQKAESVGDLHKNRGALTS